MRKIEQKEWIILGIECVLAIILACFNNEIKLLLMGKWQLILFIITVSAIFFTILKIYCRKLIEDKHKYIEDKIKELNNKHKYIEDKIKELNKLDTMIVAKFITLSESTEMVNKILDRKINYLNNNFINLIEGKKIENAPNFYPDNEKVLYEKLIKKINEPIQ